MAVVRVAQLAREIDSIKIEKVNRKRQKSLSTQE